MKQFYLNSLFVIAVFLTLTSCNPKYRFVTKGLREPDSSYVINKKGERINAAEVVVRKNSLTVDGKETSLHDLSAIKSKKMYFVVNDGELYFGEIYGKINMIYKIIYVSSYSATGYGGSNSYGGSNYGSGYHSSKAKVFYLQKQGSTDIDKLNRNILMYYVSDNEEALSKVKAAYLWTYGNYVAAAGFATGTIWSAVNLFKSKDNGGSVSLGTPLAIAGISIPAYLITQSIANHKLKKAIYIYNGMK